MTKHELLNQLWVMERENPVQNISSPKDVLPVLQKYARRKQEEFIVITLDTANNIIKIRSITKGLVDRSVVHPREVFRPAILDNAVSIIIAHNHPSGSLKPSPEDEGLTKRIEEAGEIIGIKVLDHLIISKCGYYSFKQGN